MLPLALQQRQFDEPQPFGVITTASEKAYPVDYSHFNIMGTAVGAHGIEADSDKAIFPAVDLEVRVGHDDGLKFRYPWIIPGIGSTDVAKNNWEGLAIGSALSGTGLTIGENVVGMDMEAVIENGRVVDTVDLKRRVKLYQDHQIDGYGAIIVQANVEDTRLGAQEYAVSELGAEVVELKWGQGAKNIGGESIFETIAIQHTTWRIYSEPIYYGPHILGVIQVGQSLMIVENTMRQVLVFLTGGTILALILAVMGTILAGVLIVVLVGLLTISSQTFRAARTRPAEILKDE